MISVGNSNAESNTLDALSISPSQHPLMNSTVQNNSSMYYDKHRSPCTVNFRHFLWPFVALLTTLCYQLQTHILSVLPVHYKLHCKNVQNGWISNISFKRVIQGPQQPIKHSAVPNLKTAMNSFPNKIVPQHFLDSCQILWHFYDKWSPCNH